jgi:hypothetical protein
MSYFDIADMAQNQDLQDRIYACAAQEHLDSVNVLRICAAPGWDAAWSSAITSGVENPGRDPGVISDEMILSSVQAEAAP